MKVYFKAVEGVYNIRLTDITGRIVFSENGKSIEGVNEFDANLQFISPGLYTLIVQQGKTLVETKIVKE